MALSVVVVFITTYILILPAFTLEKDEAVEQGGINIPVTETAFTNETESDNDTANISYDNDTIEDDDISNDDEKKADSKSTVSEEKPEDINADNEDITDTDNKAETINDEDLSGEDLSNDLYPDNTVLKTSVNKYNVSVSFGSDAEIPYGAELSVTEIAEDDEIYSDIQEKVENGLEEGKENIPLHPVMLDISLIYEGEKIEPAEGSEVKVEVKLAADSITGLYSDENSPVLINEKPITDELSEMDKTVQVLHMTENDQVDVMETEDEITDKEITSNFTTDSFSNWLVYLDEDLTDINLTTGDSLTLRPYTEWVWKAEDEPAAYQGGQWTFPSSEWNSWTEWENNVQYTIYQHKTNGSRFRSFSKTDDQLHETYTVVTSVYLNAGTFDVQTNKGKTIHVHVTQGDSSPKPDTVDGIPGLTVNLFDYDVPYVNGQPDFTHSGNLDDSGNKATSVFDQTINVGHNLDFLGWGYDGDNQGVNSYRNEYPVQEIVKDELTDGYPVLNDGSNQSLAYLFDTTSHNSSVYAFPNADRLFQQDNQGFYYYNSNVNYAEYDRSSNQFILYEHTYTQNTGGSNGANAKPFGFFPFHEYDASNNAQPSMNHNKNLNHHFGMSMSVDFQIPKDRQAEGPDGQKHDIIYEFSGDDDLWVFVDDELVLDIGGLHQPVTGSINFTTGEIKVHGEDDITKTFKVGAHTMKMFYLERGGCDSNLSVKFNLPLVKGKAALDVAKKSMTNDATEPDIFLSGATFGVWETPECSGEPYAMATSDSSGHVDFGYLPVTETGQKFYIKEIMPPTGFFRNSTVYIATAQGPDSDGEFTFNITASDGSTVEVDSATNYPIVRDPRPDPINLSVAKEWKNADGSNISNPEGTATFELKRKYSWVEGSVRPENSIINVYRVNSSWGNPRLMETREYAGDSTAYVNWTYNQYLDNSFKNWQYRVNNGSVQTKGNGAASISLAAGQTTNVYIFDGNLGTQWEQYGVENITVSGTEPSSGGGEITTGEGEDTDYHGPTITLPKAGGAWSDTFSNLTIMEEKNGRTYFYEYYIVEKEVPEGFEAVYYDASGNPVADPSSLGTSTTGTTQNVVNRKLLDVPIEKHWGDFAGDDITWTATFQLQQMEVKVNDSDPDAPDAITSFTNVDGKVLTISKGQTPEPEFEGLPMYRVHSNGTQYRIIYSVDETAYEVKRGNTVVAKWSKANGLEVGSRYTPQFEQDAGENGDGIDDYKIIVINSLQNLVDVRGIELTVDKTWPGNDGIKNDPDAYAKFVLKRLVHEEYRDYTDVDEGAEWVDITLDTWGNGTKLQKVHVPKGTTMHIVGSIKGSTNANKIVFTQSSGQSNLELIKDNTQSDDKFLFDITFTADQTKTITLTQGDNYVVGGRDGFFLSDSYEGHTTDEVDQSFAVEFTLNQANNWHEYFDYLPQIEQNDVDPSEQVQTIHVYSYYIEEVESNPVGYAAAFEDSQGNKVDANNGIDVSTTVTAENTGDFTNIVFGKIWKDKDGETVSKSDTPVHYTLFQIATDEQGNELYHDKYIGTYRLTENGDLQTATADSPCEFNVTDTAPVTVYGLPKVGFINSKKVTNKYYVLEEHVDGYIPDSPAAVDEGSYTITNTEMSPASEPTDVTVEKEWEGTGAENFGGVRFKLIQKRSELPKDETATSRYAFSPVTVRVLNSDGTTKEEVIRYVKAGGNLQVRFTPLKGEDSGQVRFGNRWYNRSVTFTQSTGVWAESSVIIQVRPGHSWGTDWNYEVLSGGSVTTDAGSQIDQIDESKFDFVATGEEIYVNMPRKGEATVDGGTYNTTPVTGEWKTTVNDLPYYGKGDDGKFYVYSYEVAEVSLINPDDGTVIEAVTPNEDGTGGESTHFTVAYSTGSNGEKIITNTIKPETDITLKKIDKVNMSNPNPPLLNGASFQLIKLTQLDPEAEDTDWNQEHSIVNYGQGGVFTFEKIPVGYYKIVEVDYPTGYVKMTKDPIIEVKQNATSGEFEINLTDCDPDFVKLVDGELTLIIGNESGAELPMSGGIGTTIFYVLGSLLVIAGGIYFAARRRIMDR